jgi:hypothetical protein
MPYKDLEARKKHNKEYYEMKYATDPAFKEKKRKKTAEWRKAKNGTYSQYMQEYRLRAKQYALWMTYRTTWKARRNLKTYLEVLQTMKTAEYNRKRLPASSVPVLCEQ